MLRSSDLTSKETESSAKLIYLPDRVWEIILLFMLLKKEDVEARTLQVNIFFLHCLTECNLCYTSIEDIRPLCKALGTNTSVSSLILNGNMIQDVSSLAEALKVNNTLTHLDLSENSIQSPGSLLEALKTNNALVSLDLSYNEIKNNIDNWGFITVNKTLKELILSENEIEKIDKIAEVITGVGNKTETVLKINLSYNRISDLTAFGEVLNEDSPFQFEIDLTFNAGCLTYIRRKTKHPYTVIFHM